MLEFVGKMEGPTALPCGALHVDYVEWPQRAGRISGSAKAALGASI